MVRYLVATSALHSPSYCIFKDAGFLTDYCLACSCDSSHIDHRQRSLLRVEVTLGRELARSCQKNTVQYISRSRVLASGLRRTFGPTFHYEAFRPTLLSYSACPFYLLLKPHCISALSRRTSCSGSYSPGMMQDLLRSECTTQQRNVVGPTDQDTP